MSKVLDYPVEVSYQTFTVGTDYGNGDDLPFTIPDGVEYARLIWAGDPGEAFAKWDDTHVEWLGASKLGWALYEGGRLGPLSADLQIDFKAANGNISATLVMFTRVAD